MGYNEEPISVILPEDTYLKAVNLFEFNGKGPPLTDAIERDARIAYTILSHCISRVMIDEAPTVINQRPNAQDKDIDQERSLNLLPKLGDDARDVTINVIRSPTFPNLLSNIIKRKPPEKIEPVLHFRVKELDPRLHD